MKRVIALIISTILLLSLVSPFTYAKSPTTRGNVKTVRVGYFSFQNYMLGASEGEHKSGYAYDLLSNVATINNWKCEFVYGDFNELYDMLLNNEIDILPCLVYTEERSKQHYFYSIRRQMLEYLSAAE